MKLSLRRSLVMLLVGTAVFGCSTRDHDNPLDPENPFTGGAPKWLEAFAGNGVVDLEWEVQDFEDLDAVRLVETGSETAIWTGGAGSGSFQHAGLINQITYGYRLHLVLNAGLIIELPQEIATPGVVVPWVYDAGTGNVVRLTPDCRRIQFKVQDLDAVQVVADPDSAGVLVVDFFSGRVRYLDEKGNEIWEVGDLIRPSAGLWSSEGWWVTDSGLGAVFLISLAGEVLFGDSTLTFPTALAPAPVGVWVSDRQGPVVRIDPIGGITHTATLNSPLALSATGDGGVWIADRGNGDLIRWDADGNELVRTAEFPGAEGLATDPGTNGVWVAERSRRQVLLLDQDGNRIVTISGFVAPSSLSPSPDGAEIWVADPGLDEVLRMDRSGQELTRSAGLSSPFSISVAFNPAPAKPRNASSQ